MIQLSNYLKCCCQSNSYQRYIDLLAYAENEVNSSLDIVTSTRRMRMHGVALTLLQTPRQRKLNAMMAPKRPANFGGGSVKMGWNEIEGLRYLDLV
jgi:hypothetical protein